MWFLTCLLLVPLVFVGNYLLSLSNHWTQSASEQLRLDAATLSECHSRANFLSELISPLNVQIERLQAQMDAVAARCLSDPLECEAAVAILPALSASGLGFETTQDIQLAGFKFSQRLHSREILHANQLDSPSGQLEEKKSIQGGDAGLSRSPLRPKQILYQSIFQCRWPRPLMKISDFEFQNTYHFSWRPRRSYQTGLRLEDRIVTSSGQARRESKCWISGNFDHWSVRR